MHSTEPGITRRAAATFLHVAACVTPRQGCSCWLLPGILTGGEGSYAAGVCRRQVQVGPTSRGPAKANT